MLCIAVHIEKMREEERNEASVESSCYMPVLSSSIVSVHVNCLRLNQSPSACILTDL